ncbi:MAG: hypothetical protein M1821_000735 [Bathelium mastoideum]|nr:MAG: hypothetical protein M1821_000735 [Bathelium mastoideum]
MQQVGPQNRRSESNRADKTKAGDDYVVYPDVDRDEDVVYAYHGINEKRAEAADQDDYVIYPDIDRDEDVVYAYHGINE